MALCVILASESMGIRFKCPNGHKLHVKAFLAGRRGVCPQCGAKVFIPNDPDEEAVEAAATGSAVQIRQIPSLTGGGAASTSAASPSIVIQVSDAPIPAAPPTQAGTSEFQVEEPTMPADLARVTLNSSIVSGAPGSPAARYNAQRERNRRNQMALAILLFVSVVVLAIVLILVLQRGSSVQATSMSTTHQQLSAARLLIENHELAAL